MYAKVSLNHQMFAHRLGSRSSLMHWYYKCKFKCQAPHRQAQAMLNLEYNLLPARNLGSWNLFFCLFQVHFVSLSRLSVQVHFCWISSCPHDGPSTWRSFIGLLDKGVQYLGYILSTSVGSPPSDLSSDPAYHPAPAGDLQGWRCWRTGWCSKFASLQWDYWKLIHIAVWVSLLFQMSKW